MSCCNVAKRYRINPFQLSVSTIAALIHGFDARLANRPLLVFDFPALLRFFGKTPITVKFSTMSARVPKVENYKWSVSQPCIESLNISIIVLETLS